METLSQGSGIIHSLLHVGKNLSEAGQEIFDRLSYL